VEFNFRERESEEREREKERKKRKGVEKGSGREGGQRNSWKDSPIGIPYNAN